MRMDRDTYRKALRDTLESHITLDHPIFRELMKGEPNWPLLRMMTLQGYQLTKNFLTYIEHLFFYCPLPKHKRLLLHNLYEEETGRLSKTKNHVELMQNFIRAIGVSDEERDREEPLPATRALIDYRMERVTDPARYHLGAAAVMIASEGQNLETRAGEGRHSILAKHYHLTDADTLFFSVHQKEDIGHVQEGISLVADLCDTEQMQQEALTAVDETCRLFYGMYDGVAREYARQREIACTA
jgi:pyrroloquinoline-quinone synthase